MTANQAPILQVLTGQTVTPPPVWFMRQAGRYLPEYRELRASTSGFVDFCLTPEKAAEATLQPIRRFGFDAAILFSDILMIPLALGQDLTFAAGEGPILGDLPELAMMRDKAFQAGEALKAVGETVSRVKAELPPHVTLIGFCGGPWTVMTYMLNGKKAHDRSLIRAFVYDDPKKVRDLLDIVIEASAQYLLMQAQSGAQVLKIFESWAEGFPDPWFDELIIQPHVRLIRRVRELGVTLPIIGFPRGAEARCQDYLDVVPVDCLALGTATPLALGKSLQTQKPIQGALDPVALRAGGAALDAQIDGILEAWGQGPLIFNLGHGIFPDTPLENVECALKRIRG
jgi:uroporphyrinogen decarboxylase